MTQQIHEKEEPPSLRARAFAKVLQYIEAIFINWLSGFTFLSFLWIIQQVWGLRLIPFNILDALLLASGIAIIAMVVVVAALYFGLMYYLKKNPTLALSLGLGLMASLLVAGYLSTHPEIFNKTLSNQAPEQEKQQEKPSTE